MSDSDNNNKLDIIGGIEKEAQEEAANVLAKARQYVQDRLHASGEKISGINREAAEKLKQQTTEIRKNARASLNVEQRRISLKIREKLISSITEKVKEHAVALVSKPGYSEILLGWIIEAALGLNVDKARVNASRAEMALLDENLLNQAAGETAEISGRQVKLEKSGDPPLPGQGIVITSADGRIAFNNQVQTRLLRYQSEIRKMIYDTLFKEEL